jgi:hypothetical protein
MLGFTDEQLIKWGHEGKGFFQRVPNTDSYRWNNAKFKETLCCVRVKMGDPKAAREKDSHAITGYDLYTPPPNAPGGRDLCFLTCMIQLSYFDPVRDKRAGYHQCV